MRALRFSHPSDSQLDLRFDVDGTGVSKLPGSGKGSASKHGSQLLQVSVDECEYACPTLPPTHTLLHCSVLPLQTWRETSLGAPLARGLVFKNCVESTKAAVELVAQEMLRLLECAAVRKSCPSC